MKTLAIIAEYNPMHKGHIYHIEKSIEKTNINNIIVIMSGNYTQRGELAIFNKYFRAKKAINNGVSLVLELPLIYSISSAENFSKGAIKILNKLGIVDYLSFGSESNDIDKLKKVNEKIKSDDYNKRFKEFLSKGYSYSNSKIKALDNDIIIKSNDILALEYLYALEKTKSKIKPISIKRKGSEYNESKLKTFPSALSIRKAIKNKEIKSNKKPTFTDEIFQMLIHSILYKQNITNIYKMNEGIHNRLIKYAKQSNSYEELLDNLVTRRYSKNTIRRLFLYTLLDITNEKYKLLDESPTIRVLAFDEKGREILNRLKKNNISFSYRNKTKTEDIANNLYYYFSNDNRNLDLKKKIYYKK